MANPVCEVLLGRAPILARPEASPEETGAVVDFWGVVRAIEGDAEITGIDYEGHLAMAEHQLRTIADDAAQSFNLNEVVIIHRTGFVPVGQASLFVRVASSHRGAAFRAIEAVVDELKKRAPIWKHPIFSEETARQPRALEVAATAQ
jgi:molybdopterin synthase catalytic subunit